MFAHAVSGNGKEDREPEEITPTLKARMGTGGGNVPLTMYQRK